MVNEETSPLETQVNGKGLGQTTFDLVSIPHEVILGISWLEATNPSIDWNARRITFGRRNPKKLTL